VTGTFEIGEELIGKRLNGFFEAYFAPGTVVTGVAPGSLTLSKPTTFEYLSEEGSLELFVEIPAEWTDPLPVNVSAGEMQRQLEGLPGFGAGSVVVQGGPGGGA